MAELLKWIDYVQMMQFDIRVFGSRKLCSRVFISVAFYNSNNSGSKNLYLIEDPKFEADYRRFKARAIWSENNVLIQKHTPITAYQTAPFLMLLFISNQ